MGKQENESLSGKGLYGYFNLLLQPAQTVIHVELASVQRQSLIFWSVCNALHHRHRVPVTYLQ